MTVTDHLHSTRGAVVVAFVAFTTDVFQIRGAETTLRRSIYVFAVIQSLVTTLITTIRCLNVLNHYYKSSDPK